MHRSSAYLLALPALACLAFLVPTSARAQYMYLDSNGDGVHTEADVLSMDGPTVVDVWLRTDRNRDGTQATCAVNSTTPLTINSYDFILQADGGTVRYSAFQNHVTEFTTSLGSAQSETEFYVGRGSGTIKSPGDYRLASVTIEPLSGTPFIRIAPSARVLATALTSFGCQCEATDQDNTMKLGLDWVDADGLGNANGVGAPPVFEAVSGVPIDEERTASVAITATDADSDPLTLNLVEAPSFASLIDVTSEPGRIAGTIFLQPGASDGGSYSIKVECRDGVYVSTLFVSVLVRDTNLPPAFGFVPSMLLGAGSVAEQTVTAHDPEQSPVTIRLKAGPSFVTVGATAPGDDNHYDAVVRISPGVGDAGTWSATLEASDGAAVGTAAFTIRVYDPALAHAPALDSIPDFTLSEGDTIIYRARANDADGDMLDLQFIDRPYFVRIGVDPWLWLPSPGALDVPIVIQPWANDAGIWNATLIVRDRLYDDPFALTDTESFSITVRDRPWPPSVEVYPRNPCVEPGEVLRLNIYVSDPDGSLPAITFGPPPAWGSVVDWFNGMRNYILEPTSETPAQIFPIEVSATDGSGISTKVIVSLRLAGVGECDRSGWSYSGFDSTVAEPGGPYSAVAGELVHFDGGGSATTGNYIPRFRWDFGDGAMMLGRRVEHRYAEAGRYVARLTIDIEGSGRFETDTTGVVIREPFPADAYLGPGEAPVVLRASRPLVEFHLKRVGEEYSMESISRESLELVCPGSGEVDRIAAAAGGELRVEDTDRDGEPEIVVSFARADLRRLFANVRGKRTLTARLEGALTNGARVRAPIELTVIGAPAKPVTVSPNPLNPTGVITFEVARPGRVTVRLYDVHGRLIRTLLDGPVEAGEARVPFDGEDGRGRPLASGVYYYQVSTTEGAWRGRATILK